MLHHAAHHLAQSRGLSESIQVVEWYQRALNAVKHALRNKHGLADDATVVGVGLLANAEV